MKIVENIRKFFGIGLYVLGLAALKLAMLVGVGKYHGFGLDESEDKVVITLSA